jgi:hypothetical protein
MIVFANFSLAFSTLTYSRMDSQKRCGSIDPKEFNN